MAKRNPELVISKDKCREYSRMVCSAIKLRFKDRDAFPITWVLLQNTKYHTHLYLYRSKDSGGMSGRINVRIDGRENMYGGHVFLSDSDGPAFVKAYSRIYKHIVKIKYEDRSFEFEASELASEEEIEVYLESMDVHKDTAEFLVTFERKVEYVERVIAYDEESAKLVALKRQAESGKHLEDKIIRVEGTNAKEITGRFTAE